MNLLDILSTSPHYFCRNEYAQQMRIQILILGFKGLKRGVCIKRVEFMKMYGLSLLLGTKQTVRNNETCHEVVLKLSLGRSVKRALTVSVRMRV